MLNRLFQNPVLLFEIVPACLGKAFERITQPYPSLWLIFIFPCIQVLFVMYSIFAFVDVINSRFSNGIVISNFIAMLPFILITFLIFTIRTLRRMLEILEQLFSNWRIFLFVTNILYILLIFRLFIGKPNNKMSAKRQRIQFELAYSHGLCCILLVLWIYCKFSPHIAAPHKSLTILDVKPRIDAHSYHWTFLKKAHFGWELEHSEPSRTP